MTMNRHEPFEELISASLRGDLTPDERVRLDAHLDGCAQCRATLAAFADERRMIAGLRHVAPPRDLGARVRAGIEYANVPWWRKPTTIFTAVGGSLAAVAGALLALVVLNGTPIGPPVGQASPTPGGQVTPNPSSAPQTLPPQATPGPSTNASPGAPTPTPAEATPPPNQLAASPEPDLYLAFDPATPEEDQSLSLVNGSTDNVVLEPSPPTDLPDPAAAAAAEPIAAELSGNGASLAYVGREGQSGMNALLVTHVGNGAATAEPDVTSEPAPTPVAAVGETTSLGSSVAGSSFLERLAWSPDSRFLAYTLADPEGGGTDAWVYDSATNESWQLTEVGDAYAASWVDDPDAETPALWVSRAEGTVTSYLIRVVDDGGARVELVDPATSDVLATAPNVFQPLISPNGALAIYWSGRMAREGDEWVFSEGGAPYLSEHRPNGDDPEGAFPDARRLFSDVTIDRDAFRTAAVSWSLDGNSYVVWNAEWEGLPQGADGAYPDRTRIYLGQATDPDGLTESNALDNDELPPDWSVVDVKVSPTGRDVIVMMAAPVAGLEPPTAQLLIITRNAGGDADEVESLASDEGRWYGPAVFDDYLENGEDAEAP